MIRITNVDYVILTGCQGSIRIPFSDPFFCQIKNRTLHLTCADVRSEVQFTTLVGAIYRAMFGVTKGFRNKLKTVGVGYKGILTENQLLKLTLGYSHPSTTPLILPSGSNLAEKVINLIFKDQIRM